MHDAARLPDGTLIRLGRSAVKHDPRTLRLARYVSRSLIIHTPSKVPVPAVADWPMYGNDRLGDCTIAAAGHLIQGWTLEGRGAAETPADADVEHAYIPGTGTQDDGRVELDVLNYWRHTGIAGHKIEAFAAIEATNHHMIRAACYLFGGVYVGVALPVNCQGQTSWSNARGTGPDAEPGSWGGHAVPIVGYDSRHVSLITWGGLLRASWGWLTRYMDEAYAVISQDWLSAEGKSPTGLDLAALSADLASI